MRPPSIAAQLRPQLLASAHCHGPLARSLSSVTAAAGPSHRVRSRAAVTPLVSASFFLSNRLFERSGCLDSLVSRNRKRATSTTAARPTPAQPIDELPPHRRRLARKLADASHDSPDAALPSNASSTLTSLAAAHPDRSARRILSSLLSLSKPRLTVLVVLTAMAPYALYPMPEMLTPTMTETPSLSPLTLLFLTTGTALCSASANALNMLYEPSTDAKMSRTRNRPLVRRLVSARSAAIFAILAGAAGTGALYFGVNPTVSLLGLSNIVLYAGVYTPLKAVTALNTWIGALVGGIPPLMGWAAAAGEAATNDGSWRELLFASDGSSIGGWLLAGLLFAWQFPHFMALSWPIRDEYRAAGLRMLAWTNPARNARVALRYSLVFIPICLSLCAAGVTEWSFAATSLPVNLWLAREAVRFWRFEGHKGSARGLFWASVWHLPAVMILALLHKKGLWARAWASAFGQPADGVWVEEGEAEELQEMVSMTAARVAEKTTRAR
ncbi:ubiA prenyltransferase family protein [Hirsutella rhossiliensis]|uniref:Protoheme IX farnesyltransferase, mitochondrial n=1 Tax=Hirsutella rhossiliensis TaxID=111463 RepID=A0A9P8SK25_9HYPO|nr:ubiA prenyltransferase family domain-containing protein [Hirsutella rhossiliensis]KAH0964804.1 ubiA prenyltransferase family domain-containing protein [Hirsutella rhossiliensis]